MSRVKKDKQGPKHIMEGCGTVAAVLGILLAVTPFVFGYPKGGGMTTANVVVGALMFMFGAFQAGLAYDARMICVIQMALGVIAVLTPWLMNAMQVHSLVTTHLICGVGVIGVELVALVVCWTNRRIAEPDYVK